MYVPHNYKEALSDTMKLFMFFQESFKVYCTISQLKDV